MQTEQTLADLLSDETGNLRPEVADFLENGIGNPRADVPDLIMERAPQRRRPRRRRITRWVLLVLALLLPMTIMSLRKNDRRAHSVPFKLEVTENGRQMREMGGSGDGAAVVYEGNAARPLHIQNARTGQSLQEKGSAIPRPFHSVEPQDESQEAVVRYRHRPSEAQPRKLTSLGRAKVFGNRVNVRQAPSLEASIIRKTNQGETFPVLSFSDGWYQILLGNDRPAYIFGAYLLPMDYSSRSHMVGVTRNRIKVLLTPSQRQGWYRVILPNGESRYIKENHVSIVR